MHALHQHPHVRSIPLDIPTLHQHCSQQRLGQQQHTHPNHRPPRSISAPPRHKHPCHQPNDSSDKKSRQRSVRVLNDRCNCRMMKRKKQPITKRPMVPTPGPRSRSAHHRTFENHQYHKPQHERRIARKTTPRRHQLKKGTHTKIIRPRPTHCRRSPPTLTTKN